MAAGIIWRYINLVFLLVNVHILWACPDSCDCSPDRRGQRVVCKGGGVMRTILAQLPHNTASLVLEGLTSPLVLGSIDLTESTSFLSIFQLSITRSSLQEVKGSVFASFTSLQDLDLSQNNINTIASDAFSGLSSLRSLNLSSNNLRSLGEIFDPLVSLDCLDLSHNTFEVIQASSFRTLSSLTVLFLNGNRLHNINGTVLQHLIFLSQLHMRKCGLFFISDDFFASIPRITLLDFGGNRLRNFPSSTSFTLLRQLRYLYLDDNEISILRPSQFADLHLHTLTLRHNGIAALSPEVFKGLEVVTLDLSENKLTDLKVRVLHHVGAYLVNLDLSHNPIQTLEPNVFQGLRYLETLNISACSLNTLSPDIFQDLYNLRKLDISWNDLGQVPKELVSIFDRLVVVNLHQNPWYCDCSIRPLRDWLRNQRAYHKLYCSPGRTDDCSRLSCSKPDILFGRQISLLEEADTVDCELNMSKAGLPISTQVGIVAACLVFSVMVLVTAIFLWRRGRTHTRLKRILSSRKSKPKSSHDDEDEDNNKIEPFIDCDNESLKESHRSFVFKHYFDQMVTDPRLLSKTSMSQAPSEILRQKDSVYSSNPSLYSTSIVVGIESAV